VSALEQKDFETITDFIVNGLFGYQDDDYSDDDYDPSGDDVYSGGDSDVGVRSIDKSAQATLKVMVTNAKAIYGDAGNYSQADAMGLAAAEPGYVVIEGDVESDGLKVVSVSVSASATTWTAATLSPTGTCFYISDSDDFGTLFASSDTLPCNAASMPPGQTNW
jgi:hypothetical protein